MTRILFFNVLSLDRPGDKDKDVIWDRKSDLVDTFVLVVEVPLPAGVSQYANRALFLPRTVETSTLVVFDWESASVPMTGVLVATATLW